MDLDCDGYVSWDEFKRAFFKPSECRGLFFAYVGIAILIFRPKGVLKCTTEDFTLLLARRGVTLEVSTLDFPSHLANPRQRLPPHTGHFKPGSLDNGQNRTTLFCTILRLHLFIFECVVPLLRFWLHR